MTDMTTAANAALNEAQLHRPDTCWRTANYLSVGQIQLPDNPFLKQPLKKEYIKSRLPGNRGTTPAHDGAVLPILHPNGYKIATSTLPARIDHKELEKLFIGHGYKPRFAEGSEPKEMHREEGTTPLDMTVPNDLSRFHLAGDAIDRAPGRPT